MLIGILLFAIIAVVMSIFGRKIMLLLMKITIFGKSTLWDYLLYVLLFFGVIISFLVFWYWVVEPHRF